MGYDTTARLYSDLIGSVVEYAAAMSPIIALGLAFMLLEFLLPFGTRFIGAVRSYFSGGSTSSGSGRSGGGLPMALRRRSSGSGNGAGGES